MNWLDWVEMLEDINWPLCFDWVEWLFALALAIRMFDNMNRISRRTTRISVVVINIALGVGAACILTRPFYHDLMLVDLGRKLVEGAIVARLFWGVRLVDIFLEPLESNNGPHARKL